MKAVFQISGGNIFYILSWVDLERHLRERKQNKTECLLCPVQEQILVGAKV